MTDKQATFAREFLKGAVNGKPNATAAALKAGYSSKSAKGMAHQTLHHSPEVSFLIKAALKKRRLTLDRFCKVLDEGLEAKRVISASVIVKSDDPTVTSQLANGRTVDFIDVEDYPTRHKYLETGLRLHGLLYPPKDAEGSGGSAPPQPILVLVHTSGDAKTQVVIPMSNRNGD